MKMFELKLKSDQSFDKFGYLNLDTGEVCEKNEMCSKILSNKVYLFDDQINFLNFVKKNIRSILNLHPNIKENFVIVYKQNNEKYELGAIVCDEYLDVFTKFPIHWFD